ncbi:efflux RND transporter periplasmic adaptor subunit [uncultured Paraglaciecola sp.]|uniref:efflux RND transporter periplasmic adaptor subunit n=1 Tax=uncultured Paraglaciecola sp. TaxID=1765024 RepID=UPI00262070ED|nr:efflux RND transporter periplasmic adaptor subunit [uncultured Paraglaciecola sp.]
MTETLTMKQKVIILSGLAWLLNACGQDDNLQESAEPTPTEISVAATNVVRADVHTWIFAEGTARALNREFLSFESAGRIAFVDPNLKEGDRVKKGQLIAYQEKNLPANGNNSAESLSHASIRDAQANLKLAEKTYNRFNKLLQQKSASQQEYDEAKAKFEQARVAYQNASIVADESRIVSPINGMLARLNIQQGFYFSPSQVQSTSEAGALSTVPIVIIDPSEFEVTVSLPAFYYRQLQVGSAVLFQQGRVQKASMSALESQNESAIKGFVYAISPSVDPDTRTFSVKLRSTQGEQFLQDGEYLSAWIAGPVSENVLTIPIGSTRFENNQPYVFVVDPNTNKVEKVFVTLGLQGRDRREVLKGLALDDMVITKGRSRLSDGDLVRIISDDSKASTKQGTVL